MQVRDTRDMLLNVYFSRLFTTVPPQLTETANLSAFAKWFHSGVLVLMRMTPKSMRIFKSCIVSFTVNLYSCLNTLTTLSLAFWIKMQVT